MKLMIKGMTTNVQILTDEGTVTAVVEPENRISAAYQNMRSIPLTLVENYGHWIEVLDLSHNKLRNVSPLRSLPNLHTLILDHNLIVSTTLFPRLPSLRVLWLHFNLVSDAGLFVPPLARSCPALRHLSLMGNMAAPITHREAASSREEEAYRHFVVSHFKDLIHLDDKPVTAIERLVSGGRKEEATYLDDLQNFLFDCKTSLLTTFHRRFNSIV